MDNISPVKPIFTPRSKKEFHHHTSSIRFEKTSKSIISINILLITITIIISRWDLFGIRRKIPFAASIIPWIERISIIYFISNIIFIIFNFFKPRPQIQPIIKGIQETPVSRPKRLIVDRSPAKTSPLSENSVKILSSPLGIRSPGTSFTSSSIPGTPITKPPPSALPSKSTPDTGSPKVNEELERSMPSWTDKLLKNIKKKQVKMALSPLSEKYEAKDQVRILNSQNALITLGLSKSIDPILENIRLWFSKKILAPLQQEIERLSKHFILAGLERFSPEAPITFALMRAEPFGNGNNRIRPSLRPINLSQMDPNVRIICISPFYSLSLLSFLPSFLVLISYFFFLGSKCKI